MTSNDISEAMAHFERGKKLMGKKNHGKALKEFVLAIRTNSAIVETTDIIGFWRKCMRRSLLVNEFWSPRLPAADRGFQLDSEAACVYLKNNDFENARIHFEMALGNPPFTETARCVASCLAGRALAMFGHFDEELGKGRPLKDIGDILRGAIQSQINAMETDPNVRLNYLMRPMITP